MSKMSYISYLCESNNKKELVEEVGVELANHFLNAHKTMRENRGNPAYDKLNKIHDEMQKKVPVITGDKDTDALLEDERIAQEGI